MKILFSIIIAFVLSIAATSYAQQKGGADHPEDHCCCTTYDTGQCLKGVDETVEKELDDTYHKALSRWHESDITEELKKAQAAWIAYRDANCKGELATYRKGSMGPNMWAYCEIRLARQRIQELKYIYLPEH